MSDQQLDADSADRREACVGGECRCAGDCNGDGNAAVNELVAAIGILLGQSPGSACPAADVDGDGNVTVDELVVGVGNVASEGVAARIGAHREGVLRARLHSGERAMDATMFSLLASDVAP